MKTPFRCSVLTALLLATLLIGHPAVAQDRVVVLTSYPQEIISRFEEAFEAAHPDIRMDMLWRRPAEVLDYLRANPELGADVYWAASRGTFARLAREGMFATLEIEREGLPGKIGGFVIDDPDGYYAAFEVAGFGFAINRAYLDARGLAVPQDWSDLGQAAYAGHVLMPVPSRVGFAPVIYEIVLQSLGWERGWQLLSEIGGNAALLASGGMSLSDRIAAGEQGVALTIDFFVVSAAANGAPIEMVYPRTAGFSPAHVGILSGAPHPEAARRFVEFVLSDAGQRLLAHPDIARLPVRPGAYDALPDAYNPFARSRESTLLEYDPQLALTREGLMGAVFDALITDRHAALVEAWGAIHAAEQAAGDAAAAAASLAQARALLGHVPVSAEAALALDVQHLFDEWVVDDAVRAEADALRAQWAAALDRNYREATALAREVLAGVSHAH